MYWNPFWHVDRSLASRFNPDECRKLLKTASTSDSNVGRVWLARGDATFFEIGLPAYGSILQLHVRVHVAPGEGEGSVVRLRFSGGGGSSLLLALIDLACAGAFILAVASLLTAGWSPLVGAGLVSVLIPVLLTLAMRWDAPGDIDDLTQFVSAQVDGEPDHAP
jgi:hypothetical protein